MMQNISFVQMVSITFVVLACFWVVPCFGAPIRGNNNHESNRRSLQTVVNFTRQIPIETYFVPLPEQELLKELYSKIFANASSTITAILSIAIANDDTWIWYDHWEDGYDLDVTNATAVTTQIWGDGNASNGCRPSLASCTNVTDRLMAGTSFVIQNNIITPRNRSAFYYDGSDRIQATKPIAIVKANYPVSPGAVFASAVEIVDTMQWGYTFEAPVGIDMGATQIQFERSAFAIMASMNNTKILLPNQTTLVLDFGRSATIPVNQSDRFVADKPVQVHLLTGDVGSGYESRSYAMRPIDEISSSYATPIGDSMGRTKVVIYNPNNTTLTYTFQYLQGIVRTNVTGTVLSKKSAWSPIIPTNSGAWIDGNLPFIALTVTDSEEKAGDNYTTYGQMYDWGCPVVPRSELTPQALISFGFGCTNNQCGNNVARNVVWISPVEDADIYIDFTNRGLNSTKYSVSALGSLRVSDPTDKDMSGASIFAVQNGTGVNGPTVNIAVAWGQDPSVSRPRQDLSMDMGTVILPFTNLKVNKIANETIALPGDYLLYTIRVINAGQRLVYGDTVVIKDVLDESVTYVANSTNVKMNFGNFSTYSLSDSTSGTPFPLDVAGYTFPETIPRRGGSFEITFVVQIDPILIGKSRIVNNGVVSQPSIPDIPYKTITIIDYKGSIAVENTVMEGVDGANCATKGNETISGLSGINITYCFKITNTGQAYLKNIELSNANIGDYINKINTTLAPGESTTIYTSRILLETGSNDVFVKGSPAYSNGVEIEDAAAVTATDPSFVQKLVPNITIDNRVYIGNDNGESCGTAAAVETVSAFRGTNVTYCFNITNIGNVHITNVVLADYELALVNTTNLLLGPNQSILLVYTSTIQGNLTNNANVTAYPSMVNGTLIPQGTAVTSQDPSSVVKVDYNANISIENQVYLGIDNGASCGTNVTTESVSALPSSDVIYCFKITNIGDVHLRDVVLTNYELAHEDTTISLLAPNETIMLMYNSTVEGNLTNYAIVSAYPSLSNGVLIPESYAVNATDPSSVTLEPCIDGTLRNGDKDPYKSPSNSTACLNENWNDANANNPYPDELICATNEVTIESALAENATTCVIGETIIITLDATIYIASPRGDLGWYIATDGGDALTGTCIINGLQDSDGATYSVTTSNSSSTSAGYVAWTSANGGDNDQCGDIFINDEYGGMLNTPILVETEVSCQDDNEDGFLDMALCFTWKGDTNNVACSLSDHIPGQYNECYCSRIDVTNVEVTLPVVPNGVAPCM